MGKNPTINQVTEGNVACPRPAFSLAYSKWTAGLIQPDAGFRKDSTLRTSGSIRNSGRVLYSPGAIVLERIEPLLGRAPPSLFPSSLDMIHPESIWCSSHLPTLPSVAIQLLKLSDDPGADLRELVRVIKSDPAIMAKILKSTNSSYFSFRREVTSIERAVPLLGATMVTSLALSFSLVEAAMASGPLARHYQLYWRKSVVQAVAAEILGGQTRVKDQYFLAGLLADLGRLAMLKTIGVDYAPVLDEAESSKRDSLELERDAFGFDYVDIGIKLMDRWKLPEPLIQAAIVRKWSAEELEEQIVQGNKELLSVIAVASAVSEYFCSSNPKPALERMQYLTSRHFRMSQQQLETFLEQVKLRMEEAASTFSIDPGELRDPMELMALANEHLARMAQREYVTSTKAQERQRLAEELNEKLLKENQQLQRKALHDPLTKIYNRHYFEDALMREIQRCQRTAEPVAVIFCDIDRFKNLNDTYGHPFGDQVLQEVARLFQAALRNADILARYGGEEFVVLVVQPTEKGLEKLAERIRANVAEHDFLFEGQRVEVTVSIGAAIKIPRRNGQNTGERLMAVADEAMYDSKRKGRNRVTIRSLLHEDERRLTQLVTQRRFSRWLVNRQILDIPTASMALLNCHMPPTSLGDLACQSGCLDRKAVERILKRQCETDERFGEAARHLELLSEDQLAQLLAWQTEDPKAFACQLVQDGVLTRPDVNILLEQYLAETPLRHKPHSRVELAIIT